MAAVIKGQNTSEQAIQLIGSLTEELEKIPVVVKKEVPFFALNRARYSFFREALHLVE